MKNSPLQLDHHFVVSLHLDANAEAGEQAPVIATNPRAVADTSNPLKWCVSLAVELNSPENLKAAYTGRIEFVGYFTVDGGFPKDKVEQLVRVNATSMLYAAAREMVINVTARGPWRGIQLPSISFVDEIPKDQVSAPVGEKVASAKTSA